MKQMAASSCLWMWLILVACAFIVEGSEFWAIDNQMKIEMRPYTQTATDPSTTGPTYISSVNKVLQPKFREMHRYCDGQCFYAPSACATSNEFKDCDIAASIAAHNEDVNGDLYCDYFGQDNLRQSFCSSSSDQIAYRKDTGKYDRFYTVTLHRTLEYGNLSCKQKWNNEIGRRCRRTEFIGISFRNNNAPLNSSTAAPLELDDLWYICTVDETHLTRMSMWTKIDGSDSGQQIVETKPHLNSGAGVIFSKVRIDEDQSSMGCQFVIQESNMTLRFPPANAAFFSDKTNPITVKLAAGIVKRDPSDYSILYPFYSGPAPAPPAPIPAPAPAPYAVYLGTDIKPIDTIFFDALEVKTNDPVPDLSAELELEQEHSARISSILDKCERPKKFPHLLIACYPPNSQLNCVHTGRCPVMFIVEIPKSDKSFDTITGHLYSLVPDFKSLRKVRRPTGYASVAFSTDRAMGRDVVISCHAYGRSEMSVVVSINIEKTNVYPGKVDYSHLISNPEAFGTVNKSKILCSWKMETKFLVNLFDYEPDYRSVIQPGQTEKLEFNFKTEEVYLLIAAGNRNYPDGKIVHHDFRQILKEKFSRELFLKKAKGRMLTPNHTVISLLAFSVLIIFYF